jgi:DNA-binding response OmpR family regulator
VDDQSDRRQPPVVLVVGDEPGAAEIVSRLLVRHGLRAVKASEVTPALEQSAHTLPRCIVVDLPHAGLGSALQLLDLVRSHDDDRVSSCRVLVLEASTSRQVLLASGADAHLARPVHARELVAAVDALLG